MKPGFEMLHRTLVLAIGITTLGSSIASAQAPARPESAQTVLLDSPEFARLLKGKKVIVTTSDGKQRKGDFEVTPGGLLMKSRWEHGELITSQVVPLKQIARVTQTSHHRGLGMGIGLGFAAGAATTFAFLVSCAGDECEMELTPILVSGAIGAGVGAAIGAMFDARNRDKYVIYQAPPRTSTTTISFAPILSRTRKGVAFSMTWR